MIWRLLWAPPGRLVWNLTKKKKKATLDKPSPSPAGGEGGIPNAPPLFHSAGGGIPNAPPLFTSAGGGIPNAPGETEEQKEAWKAAEKAKRKAEQEKATKENLRQISKDLKDQNSELVDVTEELARLFKQRNKQEAEKKAAAQKAKEEAAAQKETKEEVATQKETKEDEEAAAQKAKDAKGNKKVVSRPPPVQESQPLILGTPSEIRQRQADEKRKKMAENMDKVKEAPVPEPSQTKEVAASSKKDQRPTLSYEDALLPDLLRDKILTLKANPPAKGSRLEITERKKQNIDTLFPAPSFSLSYIFDLDNTVESAWTIARVVIRLKQSRLIILHAVHDWITKWIKSEFSQRPFLQLVLSHFVSSVLFEPRVREDDDRMLRWLAFDIAQSEAQKNHLDLFFAAHNGTRARFLIAVCDWLIAIDSVAIEKENERLAKAEQERKRVQSPEYQQAQLKTISETTFAHTEQRALIQASQRIQNVIMESLSPKTKFETWREPIEMLLSGHFDKKSQPSPLLTTVEDLRREAWGKVRPWQTGFDDIMNWINEWVSTTVSTNKLVEYDMKRKVFGPPILAFPVADKADNRPELEKFKPKQDEAKEKQDMGTRSSGESKQQGSTTGGSEGGGGESKRPSTRGGKSNEAPGGDPLLAQIRGGIQLRQVKQDTDNQPKVNSAANVGLSAAQNAIMARGMALKRNEEENGGGEEEWDPDA